MISVKEFSAEVFGGGGLAALGLQVLGEIEGAAACVLLAHLHAKDPGIKHLASTVDLGMVRDPLYKYSKRAEDMFFARKTL